MELNPNSPKMYCITKNGKYYNSRDKAWYNSFAVANFERDKAVLNDLLRMEKFKDCNVFCCTEDEFMWEIRLIITRAVVVGECFSRMLFDIGCRIPTISNGNKTTYNKIKQVIEALKPYSERHIELAKSQEDSLDFTVGHYNNFIHKASDVRVYEAEEVCEVLDAYYNDADSILGIARKVNKNRKNKK